jgi:hypothetical protein
MFQVKNLARDVHDKHFKVAQGTPRGVVAQLKGIVGCLDAACDKQLEGGEGWREEMKAGLDNLLSLLKDEHTMSAYEVHSSGLVQCLFNCLNMATPSIKHRAQALERVHVFRECFKESTSNEER